MDIMSSIETLVSVLVFSTIYIIISIIQILLVAKKNGKLFSAKVIFRSIVIIILLVLNIRIIDTLVQIDNSGWSFWGKRSTVEINYEDYQVAMDCWKEMDYSKAEVSMLKALEASDADNGTGSVQSAAINQKLGALYLEMGKYNDASKCLTDAYVTFQKKYGDTDGITIVAAGQLAVCDIKEGDIELGFASLNDLYDQANDFGLKIQIATMLAQCETDLGNYKRALEWYDALGLLYSEFEITNTGRIELINDYALFEMEIGNYSAACEAFEGAVSEWNKLGEEEDSTIANVYTNLSMTYGVLGENDKALEASEKALEIRNRLFDSGTIYEAMSYYSLAGTYGAMNRKDEQLSYLQKSLDIALESVGENHMCTATIYYGFGNYYRSIGKSDSAIESYIHSLEIKKNILRTDTIDTAVVYEILAECYRVSGDYDKGIENAQYAIDICEKLFGRDNIHTAHTYDTAAWIYADASDYEKAESLAEAALEIYDRQKISLLSMRAYSCQTMGYVFLKESDYVNAVKYFDEAIRLYTENGENSTEDLMNTYVFKGDAWLQNKNMEACSIAYRSALDISDVINKKRIPSYIMDRLKNLYDYSGNDQTYEEWFRDWRISQDE